MFPIGGFFLTGWGNAVPITMSNLQNRIKDYTVIQAPCGVSCEYNYSLFLYSLWYTVSRLKVEGGLLMSNNANKKSPSHSYKNHKTLSKFSKADGQENPRCDFDSILRKAVGAKK